MIAKVMDLIDIAKIYAVLLSDNHAYSIQELA